MFFYSSRSNAQTYDLTSELDINRTLVDLAASTRRKFFTNFQSCRVLVILIDRGL